MGSGVYWQTRGVPAPPPSGRAQFRPVLQVRSPSTTQQGSPAAPQATQVSGSPPLPCWQTRVAAAQLPFSQQVSFSAPQAVQMPVLLFVSPVHSVPTAVQERLPEVPQQGRSSVPQATQRPGEASPVPQVSSPAEQNRVVPPPPPVRTQHSPPLVPQVPASEAQPPAVQTPPTLPPQDSPSATQRKVVPPPPW